MAIVYRHIDNRNKVFYIGISKNINRANDFVRRSDFWKRYSKKYGVTSEILKDKLSYNDAKEIEIALISFYGRKDLKTGCLVNMTEGGDGTIEAGNKFREEAYKKRKKIIQYDLNNNFICEYNGIRYAAKKLNIAYRQLHRVLSGERKTTRGYIFKYK